MALALATVLCLASGYLLSAIGTPRRAPLLRASLTPAFGLGIFSVVYVLARALGIAHLIAADLVVFAVLLLTWWFIPARSTTSPKPHIVPQKKSTITAILSAAFALALCAALYSAIASVVAHPNGEGWDAFSIWNLHARFLFRGGSFWRDGFTDVIAWSHPDYPLLLPGAIAHFWTYLGRESHFVPAIVGLVFTFTTVAVLFSTLSLLRGRTTALLASLVLVSTPLFIEQGTSQYADVPLSFFCLAAISLLCVFNSEVQPHGGPLALSGLAAGFAAWTKNEGLLFLVAFAAAQIFLVVRSKKFPHQEHPDQRVQSWRAPVMVLAGMLPLLLIIGWFKHFVAPPGDLFPDSSLALHKLLEPSRYLIVLRWYGKELLRFGNWGIAPATVALLVFYFLVRSPHRAKLDPALMVGILAVLLTLAGYYTIYLITPHDIYWHLRNSLNRLFLQLWPSTLLLFFLAMTPALKDSA